MTRNTIPKVLGVSRPRGIAVTSLLPVFLASRKASHVKSRSPTTTPTAVPGTKWERAKSTGNWKTVARRETARTRSARLSRARPKNALISPGAAQR
jgi:hypothetical protein